MFKIDHKERSQPIFSTTDFKIDTSDHKVSKKHELLSDNQDTVEQQLEELEPTAHSSELNFSDFDESSK